MKTLIVGGGEIGSALLQVLHQYQPDVIDIAGQQTETDKTYDIMHIAFPYSPNFIKYVKKYQKKYQPKFTVIHSTVPIGTSRACGATHSPVRGIHPFLAEGIQTFVKYLGGSQASEVADYFRRSGIRVCLFDKQEATEALKLFDTEYYKTCIEFAQRVKKYCNKHGLNFAEVYTLPNLSYNDGYTKLGMPEVVRPVLQPITTPIGGHCLVPNSKLIKQNE